MPKKAKELGALEVSRLIAPGFHAVGGVDGLGLQVADGGARSWVLRTMIGNKRKKMGLGGFPSVTLASARERARRAKDDIFQGINPIAERKEKRKDLAAKEAMDVTFKECAENYIETHRDTWKNAKHAAQWSSTMEAYAYPVIGNLWVRDVEIHHIVNILEPIWKTKTETAKRVRSRIQSVLGAAKTLKLRSGDNPAEWRENLQGILPDPAKFMKVEHFKAVPVLEVGLFMSLLRKVPGISARALEFLILTNVRSHNVRHATWGEIDFETKTWAIPGDDEDTGQAMKTGVEHRVPLSSQALALLNGLDRIAGTDLIFPSPRKNTQLSDMSMTAVMRKMEIKAVPHGFRSTFRDWAAEMTNFQAGIVEKAMAHAIGDKTVGAYLRSDVFQKRVRVMQSWADFCDRIREDSKGKVVSLRPAAAG
jgi:integrase